MAIPGLSNPLSIDSGGGSLGDSSSSTGGNQTFGNVGGATIGTVSDKSWLFGSNGTSTTQSDNTKYYVALGVSFVAVAGAVFVLLRRKK